MVFLKGKQRLRVRRTEAVNALVLISHHKQVFRFGCKQGYNGMLDFGCVLRLVHAQVRKFILIQSKQLRKPLQHGIGIHHLVVVVHQLLLP